MLKALKTIVLATTEEVTVVVRARRTDLGERPDMRTELVAKAATWLLAGDATDVKKAKAYAAQAGWKVFTYPTSEKDPLGRARADVLRQALRTKAARSGRPRGQSSRSVAS